MVSVKPQLTMEMNIHNQCSNFSFGESKYFSNSADWNEYPHKAFTAYEMNDNVIPFLSTFEGIVMHELHNKHDEPSYEDESKHIQLVVAWKSEGYKKIRMFMHLIEYDKMIDWNRLKLEEYYQRYANQLSTYSGPIKDTRVMRDGTVLTTRLELDFTQRDGVLDITVSEGIKDNHTKISELIDSKT
jgi:hypothetical protein